MQTPTNAQQSAPLPPLPQVSVIRTQEGARPIIVDRPMTQRELRAIHSRREDLSDQLISVQGRRKNVADELRTADPAARAGLEDRLRVLDERIVQIETDIATTGREITSAAAGLASVPARDGRVSIVGRDQNDGPAFFLGAFVGVAGVAMYMGIRRVMGGGRRRQHSAIGGVQAEQMMRLEQSIDAIAVEVERISEGQRFTAKLMAEGQDRYRRESALRDG